MSSRDRPGGCDAVPVRPCVDDLHLAKRLEPGATQPSIDVGGTSGMDRVLDILLGVDDRRLESPLDIEVQRSRDPRDHLHCRVRAPISMAAM